MSRVNREKLLNALEYLQPGLSAKEGMVLQSNCFAFKDDYIYTYNDEVATRCKSPIPGMEGAIRSDSLLAILTRVKEADLKVEPKKSRLVFTGKRGKKFWVNLEAEISLPIEDLDYPKKKQWKLLPEDFSEAVQAVQDCASRDDASKANLNCIHLHPKWIEAFDNFQLARYRMKLPLGQEVLVRQVALRHICIKPMIEFFETDNWIHFRNAAKQIFSCRVNLDEYKNLQGHIDAAKGKKLRIPKGLFDVAQQAEVFSTDKQKPNENYVQFDMHKGKVVVSSEGVYGGYTAPTPIKYKGKKISFLILPKVLAKLAKENVRCRLSEKSLKVETGKFTFVTSLTKPTEKLAGGKDESDSA